MAQEQPLPQPSATRQRALWPETCAPGGLPSPKATVALQGPAPLWAGFPSPNLQASLLPHWGAKVSRDLSMAAGRVLL